MKTSFILFITCTLFLSISGKNQYYLSNPVYSSDGSQFSGILTFSGDFKQSDYHYDWTKTSDLLKPIEKLNIQISLECNDYLHIYITDALNQRWENPFSISDEYKSKVKECSTKESLKNLTEFGLYISENTEEPFYIELYNPSTEELIFTTENTDFLYSDIFIGFGGYFSSNDVYGFGERYHNLKLGDGKFTMWPNDTSGIYEDTGEGGYNLMGIHPLGFHKTIQNSFIGLLFNNVNAQDFVIKSEDQKIKNNKDNINENNNVLFEHRTIGGVIDYYITINDSPNEAIVSLHDIIGHPMLPPFWSLGFHQCRFGYKKTNDIKKIYQGFTDNELPIDTFWGDIDILQDQRIFTLNTDDFIELPSLINEMHTNNYKFVSIIDLALPLNITDEFYRKGKNLDCFIKSNYTKEDLVTYVWPGYSVFPDFLNENATTLWAYGLNKFYQTIKYDGIWLDMNEPAMIYVDDIERGEIIPEGEEFDPEKNIFENIPYVPGYRLDHPTIRGRTLSENSYSKLINENKFYVGYNFKPLIAMMENKITNEILTKMQNKRPFILSRSTSLGQGKYSFHWLGDNFSNYASMKNGLNGIFQFQIYGIPMTGDDICGFGDNSYDDLCARWMSFGAFFPFSRNHNTLGTKSQAPFAFEPGSKTLPSSKLALNMRYSLLRYYYSELFKMSLGESGAFFKPVFFEYYSDINAYNYIDESAMLGSALILFPVFKDENSDINVYLPKDDWNKFPDGKIIRSKNEEGGNITLSGEYMNINIFMRGGYILPYQETFKKFVANTYKLNNEPTELIINPDSEFHIASGEIIFDNDDIDTIKTGDYYYIKFIFIENNIVFENKKSMITYYNMKNIYLSKLKFFRMNYLYEEEKTSYDMMRVIYRNGKIANVLINIIDNEFIEVDLSKLNVRFDEISKIEFFKNN